MKRIILVGILGFISGYAVSQAVKGATGVWIVRGFASEPWTFELTQTGSTLTGTMRQNGEPPGPVPIFEGSVQGDAVSFKGDSPDKTRRITFTGTLRGDEITLTRTTADLGNASRGGPGLFGARGAPQVTIHRANGLRVTGRITGARPTPAGGRLIAILGNAGTRPGVGPCSQLTAEVAADGSFEFINVPPCDYVARAQFNFGDTGRGALASTTPVTVTDRDVTGIVIGP